MLNPLIEIMNVLFNLPNNRKDLDIVNIFIDVDLRHGFEYCTKEIQKL